MIFYHYHGLRVLMTELFGRSLVTPSTGYDFTHLQLRLIYGPYAQALRTAERDARACAAGKQLPLPRLSLSDLWRYRRRLFVT